MFFSLLSSLVFLRTARASPNASMYECDSDALANQDQCFFISTDGTILVEHHVDVSVAPDGYRKVVAYDGRELTVSPLPWTNGDQLVASDAPLDSELDNYAMAFEMIAPLRDAVMFHVDDLSADPTLWDKLTKVLVDCGIKQVVEYKTNEDNGMVMEIPKMSTISETVQYASTAGVNPEGEPNAKNYLLQFLEEAAIDLVCLMTDVEQERCEAIRETATDLCWEPAYEALYGSADETTPEDSAEDVPTELTTTAAPLETTVAEELTTTAALLATTVAEELTTTAAPLTTTVAPLATTVADDPVVVTRTVATAAPLTTTAAPTELTTTAAPTELTTTAAPLATTTAAPTELTITAAPLATTVAEELTTTAAPLATTVTEDPVVVTRPVVPAPAPPAHQPRAPPSGGRPLPGGPRL